MSRHLRKHPLYSRRMALLLRLLLPIAVLGGGWFGYQKLSTPITPPPPPPREARLIEVTTQLLQRSDYQVTLRSEGLVQPHNQTSLTPRVSGRIINISPKFESGSFFQKNDTLLELDQTDFLAALTTAEARLARAEASLAQEEARAKQALLDWKDLGYTTPPTDLVLRKPQLKEAKANVKAAQANVSDAHRQLERTKVIAPYAGRVKSRLVGLGQSVSPGTKLGEIFSTDFAEIRLSLSAKELSYVKLPNNPDDPPIPITITDALTENSNLTWDGTIVRTEGLLDSKSRKLFIIARVDDPFGLKLKSPNKPKSPLRIGQPVRASLQGEVIPNVYIIPRNSLRTPTQIYIVNPDDSRLRRRWIESFWGDPENILVRTKLPDGWHLVTSRPPAVPNGAKVKILPPQENPVAKSSP